MKFSTILIIGIAVLAAINLATAQPEISHDLFDNEHYIIVGHIYEPYTEDNEVVLINANTGECLSVATIDCKVGIFQPPMKEYLFNLANLHQGWTRNDTFILTYGYTAAQFNITNGSIAYQQDIQRPNDVDPILILTGFVVLAAGGGYFYIRKKKDTEEVTTLEEIPTKEKQTGFKLFRDFGVRALISTLLIVGCIVSVLYAMYLDNSEMIKSIATVYGPAITAVIVFYFNDRSKNNT